MKGESMKREYCADKRRHSDRIKRDRQRELMEQPNYASEYARKQMARKPYAAKGDKPNE